MLAVSHPLGGCEISPPYCDQNRYGCPLGGFAVELAMLILAQVVNSPIQAELGLDGQLGLERTVTKHAPLVYAAIALTSRSNLFPNKSAATSKS